MSDVESISRFLSYVLRHDPGAIGLDLDASGWARVETLIQKARENGRSISWELVQRVRRDTDKDRFSIQDGRIRANYGHSIDVDLGVEPEAPPATLYHGTARRALSSIREDGLRPQSRQYVHLSVDTERAVDVARRHGEPVVLEIHAGALHADGHPFFRTAGDVWLTTHVPLRGIEFPE
ncbi:RNA--NAD 2'-phosphotransferase [Longibacter salinarum]|uniref:Probable RNA 2'-phosphotransferase n=1 Tax=Longibacter salinarum TaxID=1850348 RepID=A0A2A8CU75_9BACT|nr:RNA 2'-phosphotransferase [Longibacter salinarum]PEN11395.1 RNA--NAD 2'-phosphotransferase [Longibacter salinarum]